MLKPWKWDPRGPGTWVLVDGRDRGRANVWANGVWHTWDEDGVGGENGVCEGNNKVHDAMDQVMAAVVRQGWTPWKVEYRKVKAEIPAPQCKHVWEADGDRDVCKLCGTRANPVM